jgi:hypothetical protein
MDKDCEYLEINTVFPVELGIAGKQSQETVVKYPHPLCCPVPLTQLFSLFLGIINHGLLLCFNILESKVVLHCIGKRWKSGLPAWLPLKLEGGLPLYCWEGTRIWTPLKL